MKKSYRMRLLILLTVCFAAVAAAPRSVTIRQYPQMANVLFTWNWSSFEQFCGGTILSNGTILTAAHCVVTHPASRFRLRLGSTFASNGGVTINVGDTIIHPHYNSKTEDHDIALIFTASAVTLNDQMQAAVIAGCDYTIADNEVVYALGWNTGRYDGIRVEELGEVEIQIINQNDCVRRYSTENVVITDNMLCAGSLDAGGRDQCQGDYGGPLLHNGVVVGVYSFSLNCGVRFFPAVNVRVSRVSNWIKRNIKSL